VAAKTEAPPSPQGGDKPDPVLAKAKSTVAAQMEDPDSVEFGEMKRALRKNTLGKRIDTICGSIKGKSASREESADRPFLYLVQEDEAYVVDGRGDSMATRAYRNICN
jgi:tRNA G37 N-methylase Trm5